VHSPTAFTRGLLPAVLAVLALACGSTAPESANKGPYDTEPIEPAEAAQTLHLVDGFHAELFASEPNVFDPVEMCFDENGGVYVAEMLDYPFDPKKGEQPKSRVRYLIDSDGDGKIDESKIFADHLLQVTSVFPWKGGIFVASAPDILYLKDTNGDHVADTKEVWYTGFDTGVSPESRITNFRFNVDNWIYAANNGRPGKITSPKFPDKPSIIVRGYDFRFQPETGDFAPAAGPTQFGMSFNDWGERFVTQNTVHLRHAVLPARYILRNPYFAPDSMLQYVPEDDPGNSKIYPLTQPQEWRKERTAARQERYDSTQPGRVELVGGHFTASTGTTVYSGDAWGDDYYGNVFIADANGGIVHRELLSDNGVTYRSEPRPKEGKEFWATTDIWSRPVNLANAPDGNLYVMDFYREYIEEPASIPEAIKQRLQLDFYRGADRGRIWRIVSDKPAVQRGLEVELGQSSTAELVALLNHRNGWHRFTAQRLLLERQDKSAVPALEELASSGETPQARLHALWTLDGLGALTAEHVQKALADKDPNLRRNAVRLAEGFQPELAGAILALKDDSDPKVRFQVALSLGNVQGAVKPLAAMAAQYSADPWMRAALLTSVGQQPWSMLNRLILAHADFFKSGDDAEGRQAFLKALAAQIGANPGRDQLTLLLQALGDSPRLSQPAWKAAVLTGLARGLDLAGERRLVVPASETLFARWMADKDEGVRNAALEAAQYFSLPGMLADARRAATSEDIDLDRRVRAVRFLRGGTYAEVAPALSKILSSAAAPELHVAAIETFTSFDDPEAAKALLSGWAGYGPAARQRAVDALIRRTGWVGSLLDAIESGEVKAAAIDPVAKIRLAEHPEAAVRERAAKLFGAVKTDRAKVVEQFQDVLTLDGDAKRGGEVFKKNCAKCHLAQGERGRIGPDLSGINNKTREELLSHILDPSFEIQSNYTNYIIVDKQGRIYDGLLAAETAEAVTLRGEYENISLRRDEIEEMRASNVSLMPEGLEEDMSRQDLADVIAYLRAGL
jgi:putative membrane-bound dehydrogenase-like protein